MTKNRLAKIGKNQSPFMEDVLVNDQLVKRGTYRVKFDAKQSHLTILEDDGDVLATAKVNVKMGDRKALYNSVAFAQTAKGKAMTSLTFEGDQRLLVLDEPVNNMAESQGSTQN